MTHWFDYMNDDNNDFGHKEPDVSKRTQDNKQAVTSTATSIAVRANNLDDNEHLLLYSILYGNGTQQPDKMNAQWKRIWAKLKTMGLIEERWALTEKGIEVHMQDFANAPLPDFTKEPPPVEKKVVETTTEKKDGEPVPEEEDFPCRRNKAVYSWGLFTLAEWRKFPVAFKERWWKETSDGNESPNDELRAESRRMVAALTAAAESGTRIVPREENKGS